MKRKIILAGAKSAFAPPGIILMITFFAFGAMVRALEFPLALGIGLTLTTFAIPSQIVLLDEVSRGAAVLTTIIAVTLTAIRLFPMTMSLLPILRTPSTPRWQQYLLSHFIAVSVWVQSMISLPSLEREDRVPFYIAHCLTIISLTVATTIAGFYVAQSLPALYLAAALIITPLYFFLSLFRTATRKAEKYACLFGTVLAIPMMIHIPDYALILAGVIGGSMAYCLDRLISNSRK